MESGCANHTAAQRWHGLPAAVVWRLRGAAVLTVAVAAMVVAGMLQPDPSGAGTHQQLCLPSCSFLDRTGWPCPTCGMTTSLAAMAHGDVALAFRAQPFGVGVFVVLVAAALAGGVELLAAWPILGHVRPRLWWGPVAVGALLLSWAVRLAVGWGTGELPIR
ncbi:MAG: DUF2752 domain-containing protein [Phycisphaerae bacterium]|nr:DUF2752 domain-containing protein [Phycisphaerae bacterium]